MNRGALTRLLATSPETMAIAELKALGMPPPRLAATLEHIRCKEVLAQQVLVAYTEALRRTVATRIDGAYGGYAPDTRVYVESLGHAPGVWWEYLGAQKSGGGHIFRAGWPACEGGVEFAWAPGRPPALEPKVLEALFLRPADEDFDLRDAGARAQEVWLDLWSWESQKVVARRGDAPGFVVTPTGVKGVYTVRAWLTRAQPWDFAWIPARSRVEYAASPQFGEAAGALAELFAVQPRDIARC